MPPSLYDGDESYDFNLENDTLYIEAPQYSGAVRALSTFAQLVDFYQGGGRFLYKIDHSPMNISDSPRFPYRGYMLDTSRHFYKV